tara:strand:- start:2367 stop:2591 length:225 start_codon:yes stop_codon:yes gene_type:complete
VITPITAKSDSLPLFGLNMNGYGENLTHLPLEAVMSVLCSKQRHPEHLLMLKLLPSGLLKVKPYGIALSIAKPI